MKNYKKVSRVFILVAALFGSTSAFSMQWVNSAFCGLSSLAHWLLVAMPVASGGFDPSRAPNLQDNIASNVSPIVHTFFEEIAQSRNIQGVRFVTHAINDYGTKSAAKIIYIPEGDATQLTTMLLKKQSGQSLDENEQLALDTIAASIHHELSHIARQSCVKKANFECASPFITQAIWILGNTALSSYTEPLYASYLAGTEDRALIQAPLNLATGAAKLWLSFKLCQLYGKWDEMKADDGIPNEEHLLKAAAAFHDQEHRHSQKVRPQGLITRHISTKLPLVHEVYDTFTTQNQHPTDLMRKNRFETRLKAIQKNKQQRQKKHYA